MKITILALNSSYSHTNLAVRILKNCLSSNNFDADILEFNLKDKYHTILSALFKSNADIYGFSTYIWNRDEMLSLASDLKKLLPKAKILFGGPEVSFDADELIKNISFIDYVICGEGENAIVELARMLESGIEPPNIMNGTACESFTRDGGIHYTNDELSGEHRMLYYESSRGCPYRCAYCLSALSGSVRAKSVEKTLEELSRFEALSAHTKVIKLVDRTFNFDRARARKIWRALLDEKYTNNYHFEICAELLEEEDFALLASFPKGKIQLEIGVQSTNPETLHKVNRVTKPEAVIATVARLYELGNIHVHADLIAGLPCEGFERFGQSFDELYGHCDMLQLGFLKLLRGSKLRDEADSFGCIYSDKPPYEVLSTDCLSFDELRKLHLVDELNDRLSGKAFYRTMKLISSREKSMFALFCRLSESFEKDNIEIRSLSQSRLYVEVYDRLSMGEDRELAMALSLDYLTSQATSLPNIGNIELSRIDDSKLRRRFMDWAENNNIEYFPKALETRSGEFVIDRYNKRAFREEFNVFVEI